MKRKQYIAPTATPIVMDTENVCDMNLTSNPAITDINNSDLQGGSQGGGWDGWDNLSKGRLTYNNYELWSDEDEDY